MQIEKKNISIPVSAEEEQIFNTVAEAAENLNFSAYAVGGFVRDKLLDRSCKDIDITCVGSGIELAKETAARLEDVKGIAVYKNFGTALIKWKEYEIEFVGARKESYRSDSRKPIVENGTLEDDLKRRDFTINALAIALDNNHNLLLDAFDGYKDLQNGLIRTPLEPEQTFSDDPLRMLRAARFACQLQFRIEEKTFEAMSAQKERIRIISSERIRDELNKILSADKPSIGFKILFSRGLLHIIFPELTALHGVKYIEGKGHKDNFYHTLQVVDNVAEKSDNLWLRWAALLHDIAKPATQRFDKEHGWTFHGHDALGAKMAPKIFNNLKLPLNEKMRFVQKLVALHLRPIALTKEEVSDAAIRKLLFEAGDDIDELMQLCEADITSKNEARVERYLQNFQYVRQRLKEVEERDHIRNFQPPVSGGEIMKTFRIKPSPEVGIIKNAIKEAILEGEIKNDYQEAYQYMLQKGAELGLKKPEK